MIFKHFFAVFVARNREFIRDTSAWTWNILFPIFLVAGLAVAFSEDEQDIYKVGVIGEQSATQQASIYQLRYVSFITVDDVDKAIEKVRLHSLDMLLDNVNQRYWINNDSSKGYMLEKVLLASKEANFDKQSVFGRPVRYIDWLLPGLLGMNIMFSCLFGVGFVIVRYRKSKVLRRFKSTPLRPLEFLLAQIASRLWLAIGVIIVIFFGCQIFLELPVRGSYFDLLVVYTLGAISLISMGLTVASRTSSQELASGLLNAASFPMMMLSGVWFSLEGAHPILQTIAQILPLTHLINAARGIMLDGVGLADVLGEITILAATTVLFLFLGSVLFRWE